jgi:hypothetical protein
MVPVIDSNQKPLMPCSEKRARKMVESRKATPFWKRGVFCIRLNVEPLSRTLQPIAVGIDPGSKREGFTVKSEAHTYLNIQATAVTWVKDAVEVRRGMRRSRRLRKTPYRACRANRGVGFRLPPSTRARWGWKVRIATWLSKMFPITAFVVENIQARTIKNARKWNASFSPLEIGKTWFYEQLNRLARVDLKQGYETHELRTSFGLKKSSNKLAEKFSAHCVDSWVLANDWVGGHMKPDNERMLLITPLRFHRRQLHFLQPRRGGVRARYGGTLSHGFKRGGLVRHVKLGLAYVGGFRHDRISLHSLSTGKRLTVHAKRGDCKLLTYNSWRTRCDGV